MKVFECWVFWLCGTASGFKGKPSWKGVPCALRLKRLYTNASVPAHGSKSRIARAIAQRQINTQFAPDAALLPPPLGAEKDCFPKATQPQQLFSTPRRAPKLPPWEAVRRHLRDC